MEIDERLKCMFLRISDALGFSYCGPDCSPFILVKDCDGKALENILPGVTFAEAQEAVIKIAKAATDPKIEFIRKVGLSIIEASKSLS